MEEHKSIHEAMVAIMGEADPIAKSRTNSGQGYNFRGVAEVYQALQLVLVKHGVFTTSEVIGEPVYTEYTTSKGTLTFRTRAVFRFRFNHTTGGAVTTDTIGEGMDTGDKASNKAMSVAHKYALLQAFMIPTAEPKDPENDNHDVASRNAEQPPRREAPAPERTQRQKVGDFIAENKQWFEPGQMADLRTEYASAGTTPALLEAVLAKAKKFLASNGVAA